MVSPWKAWGVVALLVTGYSGYYLCRSNLSVSMPLIVQDMASPARPPEAVRVWLGSVASLGVLAYALGKIPSGRLADRFGGRGNFLGGMAGAIAATAWFAAAGTTPMLTAAWIANRLVQTLGWVGAVKIVSRWFPFHRHGAVMGVISLSYLFGDALARQFLSLLIRRGFTWRMIFATSAGVLGLILVLCLALLRESPGRDGARENPSNLFQTSEAADWRQVFATFFRSRAFGYACALSLGATILRETFNLWTPTYFTQVVHMSAADAAAGSSIFPLLGGFSVIFCGWFSDRMGRTGRAAIILGGMAGAALLLFWLSAARVASASTAIATVGALAVLLIGPYSFLAGAISLDFGGKRAAGTASGIIDTAGYLGGVISGDTIARISAGFGWSGTFRFLAAIALLTALGAVLFLQEQRRIA
jgi:OPA family glycerol-3-phosphate transporter-like MFS transporter